MESPKQHIYCRLMNHGFVVFRAQESWAAGESWWWLFRHRRRVFRQGAALANLLHNIHRSILEPEFGENDLGFVNHAIPRFLEQVGGEVDPYLAGLLLAFYESVPPSHREKLTWHPDGRLRALDPQQRHAEPGAAPDPAGT